MDITNVKYTEQGSISATIDGQEFSIPDQAGNRHRQMIAEWEAEGNTIAAYVAPATPRRDTGTAREFMDLFTPSEKLAIVNLSMSNAEIKLWYDEALAGDVWLGHPNVNGGLSAMVSAGVLTLERTEAILEVDFNA